MPVWCFARSTTSPSRAGRSATAFGVGCSPSSRRRSTPPRAWSSVRPAARKPCRHALPTRPPPRPAEAIGKQAGPRYARLFHHAPEHGVYLAPSAFEVGFLSAAHDEAAIDRLVEVLSEGLQLALAVGER